MSLSHKSSFETVVVEKIRGDLQFLAKPNLFKKEVDLQGLSDSLGESFTVLKRWQQAAACYDHPLSNSTINKLSDFGNDCYHAIELTLTSAQKGHLLATNVSIFCDALTKKHNSIEHLDSLLLKLNTIADKGYGRSVEVHGRLICIRAGLSQISENIPSIATKIQEDVQKSSPYDPYAPVNGINAAFVSIPPTLFQTRKGLSAVYKAIGAAADSDDEDAVGTNQLSFDRQTYSTYPRETWYTFQNLSTQLGHIVGDISQAIEHVGQCVEWWGRMKAGLETLKGELAQVVPEDSRSLLMLIDDVTDGWSGVADQFALYVYKTSQTVTGYYPYVGQRIYTPARAWTPPPRARSPPSPVWSPSPGVIYPVDAGMTVLPPDSEPKDNSQSFWKRLSCIS